MRSKREPATRQPRGKSNLSQLGLFGVDDDEEEDDPALEAELMSILTSGSAAGRGTSAAKKAKGIPVVTSNLDQMIAESLRDVSSGEDSSGEDDPSLLAELEEFAGAGGGEKRSGVAVVPGATSQSSATRELLEERLRVYREAQALAEAANDLPKARRLVRGVKTLEELVKRVERGGQVEESEIPLPVSLGKSQSVPAGGGETAVVTEGAAPPPVPPRSSAASTIVQPGEGLERGGEGTPGPAVDEASLATLSARLAEYKRAAVQAKKAGDLDTAKAHVRIIKQFESVIGAVERGQKVDMSTIPPPPPGVQVSPPTGVLLPSVASDLPSVAIPPSPISPPLQSPHSPVSPSLPPSAQQQLQQSSEPKEGERPASVLEALEARLTVFRGQAETAGREGNAAKARRMGRIVKQYEDAIRLHRAGKEIPVDDLPTPPGFPPIPVEKKVASPSPVAPRPAPGAAPPPPAPLAPPPPANSQQLSPQPPAPLQPPPSPTPSSSTSTSSGTPKSSGRSTRQDKQLALLLKRQKEWKEAAVAAKKSGDLSKAKECLRQAKGFDPLIEATHSGLPVDLTTIPVPPKDKIENEFEVVSMKDCLPGSNSEIYEQLKADLKKQFKMCMETRGHYKSLGDVGNTNKWEQLAVHTKKDLDRLGVLQERDDPLPRYHYEMRTFSILRSNTDLSDNDLELSIIQGVNYNVPNPKEIDTYVRYEFPYPSEDPKKDKTPTVYNTNNPEYNFVTVIPILRSNRACQRVFKRHSLKMEVWSKGGFLRSDSLVGTVAVKLQPLETKCSIHDSFNLMDGRKAVGGKLEVKIRLRQPIQENEVEQVKEKWLLID